MIRRQRQFVVVSPTFPLAVPVWNSRRQSIFPTGLLWLLTTSNGLAWWCGETKPSSGSCSGVLSARVERRRVDEGPNGRGLKFDPKWSRACGPKDESRPATLGPQKGPENWPCSVRTGPLGRVHHPQRVGVWRADRGKQSAPEQVRPRHWRSSV